MVRTRSKKGDPLSEHARALAAEIAALESEIRELDTRLQSPPKPAAPTPVDPPRPAAARSSRLGTGCRESEFEAVPPAPVAPARGPLEDRKRYNELGARKFDLPDAWERLRRKPRKAAPENARLINYLAAGSIQGLRPLRYEKRVARNRVLALSLLLLFVVWGLVAVFVRG